MIDRIERLKDFLKQTPDDCFLNHALALEYIKLGNDTDALVLFEKNVAHDPNYVASYYHLGKLLERIGQQERAITIYETGMKVAKAAGDMHSYSELQGEYEDLAY
ncbi:MAG: tetratricopeptide repeat protein [Bacteroidota bacterium]